MPIIDRRILSVWDLLRYRSDTYLSNPVATLRVPETALVQIFQLE